MPENIPTPVENIGSTAPKAVGSASKFNFKKLLLPLAGLFLLLIVALAAGGIVFVATNQQRQGLQQQADKAADLQTQLTAAQLAEQQCQDDLVAVGAGDECVDASAECTPDTIDLRVGQFTLPCNWHSYTSFGLSLEIPGVYAYGYAGDAPITLLYATDAPVGDVYTGVNEYSAELGNFDADPIVEIEADTVSFGGTASNMPSSTGITFRKLQQSADGLRGATVGYYATHAVGGTVYMVTFSNNSEGTDMAWQLADTFTWD